MYLSHSAKLLIHYYMEEKIKKAAFKIYKHFKPEDRAQMHDCLREFACIYEKEELLNFLEDLDSDLTACNEYQDKITLMQENKK